MLINKKDYKLAVEYLDNEEVISLPFFNNCGALVNEITSSLYLAKLGMMDMATASVRLWNRNLQIQAF